MDGIAPIHSRDEAEAALAAVAANTMLADQARIRIAKQHQRLWIWAITNPELFGSDLKLQLRHGTLRLGATELHIELNPQPSL